MSAAYRIDYIGGQFPAQAHGEWIDGRRFYFRERGGYWSFGVGETDDDAIDASDDCLGPPIAEDYHDGYAFEVEDVRAVLDRLAEQGIGRASK